MAGWDGWISGEGVRLMQMIRRCLALLGFVLLLNACSGKKPVENAILKDGLWRATLQLPGGELPFGLEFATEQGATVAWLINGSDRIRVSEVTRSGDSLGLRMPGFENRIDAKLVADTLVGTLTMVKSKGRKQLIPFSAKRGETWRFSQDATAPATESLSVSGRWAVTFVEGSKASAAVGEFQQTGTTVTGTFLTPTGDHRFLAGELRGRELKLSKFDGGHAFLYHATVNADGSLQGQFWSGLASLETLTARRDDNASLGAAESATQLVKDAKTLNFRFPDLGGSYISLSDPFFKGKVVIVALAGSWCPNCHDEAAMLAELHRRKRDQGLEVVSLMFEQFGDFNQAAAATYRFRERYRIEYTTLIAGISDKDDAASKLPQLNGVFAFPTTLFIDRLGKVRKVHTGFSGPATGIHYEKTRKDFEQTTDALLLEPKSAS